jgi:hypothetical protein
MDYIAHHVVFSKSDHFWDPSNTGPRRSAKSRNINLDGDAYLPVHFGRKLLSLESTSTDSTAIRGYNYSAVGKLWASLYPNQSPLFYHHVYFFIFLPGHNWLLVVIFPQQLNIGPTDYQVDCWL